jgi:soluble lytic murein transglycosylase-like protein
VNGGDCGSLVELDLRAARAQRLSEARRLRFRTRRRIRRRVSRPVIVSAGFFVIALGAVGTPRGIAEAHELVAPPKLRPSCPLPPTLRPAFVAAARRTELPVGLLVAVGQVESGLDQTARSEAGAIGLLQLMPTTAAELHLDPSQLSANVLAGARYLKLMLNRYRSVDLALAAYNAGPAAVDRAGGPPTRETRSYVTNVRRRLGGFRDCV